jgi:hypothetical protein
MRRDDLVRLARILGMLGSDHVGERAAAGLAAHKLVQVCGVTWWELLAPRRVAPPATERLDDPLHEPLNAAASRMRQLRGENERLARENRRLRQQLKAERPPHRPGATRR